VRSDVLLSQLREPPSGGRWPLSEHAVLLFDVPLRLHDTNQGERRTCEVEDEDE